jgi:hypothetical protein
LSFPKIKTQDELVDIAEKVIIPDIQGRINNSIDLGGKKYRALAQSTRDMKAKREYRPEPLMATGQLRKSFKYNKRGESTVVITPSGVRKSFHGEKIMSNKELTEILQVKGVRAKAGRRFFKFFGISREAERTALDFMEKTIKGLVRDARPRTF